MHQSRNRRTSVTSHPTKAVTCGFAAVAAVIITTGGTFAQLQEREDILVFELAEHIQDPDNFNWFFPGLHREHGAHQAMWEPLFVLDYATGKLEPWLAESLEPDMAQKVWTLTLRDGIKWSDGKRFTADDVVFTVDLVIDHPADPGRKTPDIPAMEAVEMRRQVESVARVDDLTVRFILKEPNPRFKLENFGAGRFGSFLIMPKHIWEKVKQPEKNLVNFRFDPPIGTGPYRLKDASEKEVVWERDEGWWGAQPVPDGDDADKLPDAPHRLKSLPRPEQLTWRYIRDEFDSKTALVKNELDAARAYTLKNFTEAKAANPTIVGWDDVTGLAWNDPCPRQLEINVAHQIDGKLGPWAGAEGVKLRQALSLLIDRKKLASKVYGDTTEPSSTMFVQYGALVPLINAITGKVYGNAEEAKPDEAIKLLDGAGYRKEEAATGEVACTKEAGDKKLYKKGGKALSVKIAVNDDLTKELEATGEIKDQLCNFGIQAEVEPFSKELYWGEVVPKGKYEMTYSWLSCGSIAEPFTSMDRYTAEKAVPIGDRSPGFSNTGRWKNNAYTTAVAELGKLSLEKEDDKAKEEERLRKIEDQVLAAYQQLHNEMPIIPLVQSPTIIPFSTKYWTGWPSAELCKPPAEPPAAGEPTPGGPPKAEPTSTCVVPMHSWAATHRLIHSLEKVP